MDKYITNDPLNLMAAKAVGGGISRRRFTQLGMMLLGGSVLALRGKIGRAHV